MTNIYKVIKHLKNLPYYLINLNKYNKINKLSPVGQILKIINNSNLIDFVFNNIIHLNNTHIILTYIIILRVGLKA